ncbi:453_t:CDS:2 [Cetraspora pellucida]|uniref:453_t:CDS:1 n=1 Tax=Cetraspora pellucida TaxID=1433469 RepID=A0A9N9G7X9_9GLOM|nr:453_t:CDS:2 [Cetraspora pellucida]
MSDNEIIFAKRKTEVKEKSNLVSKKSWKILNDKEKKELYQFAKNNSSFTQQELANEFEIGRSTVADILAKSSYWLSLDEESTIAQQKRSQMPDHPQLEEVLACWFDLALENNLTITGIFPLTETDKYPDMELLADVNNNNEEIELENLITQFQNLKNPENPKYLNISINEFIEIDSKYTTDKMPTIEDIIKEIQENESEEEPKQQKKIITATQAFNGIDSVLGYLEQLDSNLEIDSKVFTELKQVRKELVYLAKKSSKQMKLNSFFIKE